MNEKILNPAQAWAIYLCSKVMDEVAAQVKVSFGDVSRQRISVSEESGYVTVTRVVEYNAIYEEIYADWEMFAIGYGLV